MRYTVKNAISFILHEKLIFVVMILCILCSSMILNFSYGLYQNYNSIKIESEIELNKISPTIADGFSMTKGDLKKYSEALSPETLNSMEVIYGAGELEGFPSEDAGNMYMRYTIRNGEYHICETTKEAFETQGQLISGRYIDNIEEAHGENVALISNNRGLNNPNMINDDTIRLFGKEYKVIGVYDGAGACPIVPFLTVPNDFPINGFGFIFYHNITRTQYNELIEVSNEVLPGMLIFEDLQFPDIDTIYLYNNIMMISVLISVLSAINLAMLYLYMIKKRSHDLAVFRTCGCSKSKAIRLYLGECMLISIPTYLIGTTIYIVLMKLIFSNIFEFMEQAYTTAVYLTIFAIYLISILVVLEIMIRRKISRYVMDGLKGGKI